MQRRSGSIRGLLWALASTLVLKAAVPLFAAGAAYLQGVPVGSICGIYGVTLPSAKADPHAGHHGHHHGDGSSSGDAPAHSDRDHCALTGLAAMAVPDVAASLPAAIAAVAQVQPHIQWMCAGDACDAWAARMQHPPPIKA